MDIDNLLIQLPKILDERGNLSFLENGNQIPFEIKRVHWIYDVPGGERRGGVAYKETEEFIIAISGSFDLVVDNGVKKTKYSLNRSYMGVCPQRNMAPYREFFDKFIGFGLCIYPLQR